MLAFLGAIICIIASIAPASTGTLQGAEGDPGAANAVVGVGGDGQGSVPGTAPSTGTATGMDTQAAKASVLDAHLGQGSPLGSGVHLGSTSRFLCLPLTQDCPSSSAREDLLLLRTTADHLSQMVTQQKDQIFSDQEIIKELTGKLSQCENGLEPGYFQGNQEEYAWDAGRDNLDHLADDDDGGEDDEDESGRTVQELEQAIHTLRDRIEKLEVQELEVQLLSRLAELERDRLLLQNESSHQRQHLESQLNTLHHRVTGLEKDAAVYKLAEGYKIVFPVRTNYMYARLTRSLPEMYSFTICLWLKSDASMRIGTPFSYAVPGQTNEIVLLEWGNNPIELLVNAKVAQLPLRVKDGRWHHVCVTWTTRDGTWEAYQDGTRWGTGDNLAPWHAIKPGGILIFGQEQDTLGGRFDATQAFVGELAQFNVWDRVLTSAEIISIANCSAGTAGNVLPWEDQGLEVFGGVTKWPLESCDERRRLGSD
eukprot:gi/632982157/ref/XP_007907983.1/ PREDICTED: neuronal pentraxin receptor [Callorhinchus milii]